MFCLNNSIGRAVNTVSIHLNIFWMQKSGDEFHETHRFKHTEPSIGVFHRCSATQPSKWYFGNASVILYGFLPLLCPVRNDKQIPTYIFDIN